MKVFGARIIVKEDRAGDTTKGGIIIPGQDKQPTFTGTVIAVGDGAMLEDGTKVPMDLAVGDRVVYTNFSGSPVSVDGETVLILNQRDVLCVFE